MNFKRALVAILLVLPCLAAMTPVRAAASEPSTQDARLDQVLSEAVAGDPTTQLYVAEALAAMGRAGQAELLRRALIDLALRRADGDAIEAGLTMRVLLQRSAHVPSLASDDAIAMAWGRLVAVHVRLQFLDADAAAKQALPVDARPGTHSIAPGLWVPAERTGSMMLFVTAHQDAAAPLLLDRLHVQWLGERLTCTPALGAGSRDQDATLICEGPAHADRLSALSHAVNDAPGRPLTGSVEAGEFDTPGTIAAWTGALAAGHDGDLKAMLARQAPCETERDASRRCTWTSSPSAVAHLATSDGPSSQGLWARAVGLVHSGNLAARLSWFFAGVLAAWLFFGRAQRLPFAVALLAHFGGIPVLAFATFCAVEIGALFWPDRLTQGPFGRGPMEPGALDALVAGIVVGGVLHLVWMIVERVRESRG